MTTHDQRARRNAVLQYAPAMPDHMPPPRKSGSSTANTNNTNTTKPPSWHDGLPVHPAAEMFPLMSRDELKALGEDIIANGLKLPIVLWSDGRSPQVLLDGRNRLDAIEIATGSAAIIGAPSIMAGENFLAVDRVVVLDRSIDPWAYVMSANLHRRHLSDTDRRKAITDYIARAPQRSDRAIAKELGVDHH